MVFFVFPILSFRSSLPSSAYISVFARPKIIEKFWTIVDFDIFLWPQEPPSYLFWIWSYENHKMMQLCCLKAGAVSVVHYFLLPELHNLEKCSIRKLWIILYDFQRYKLQYHWINRVRVIAILLHCCFSAHKEFQTSCSYSCTWVSLGW